MEVKTASVAVNPATRSHIQTQTRQGRRGEGEKHLQFLNEFLKVALRALCSHDVEHDLANLPDLTGLGVASALLGLVGLLLGKSDAEDAKKVAISCANIYVSFDERLPLADQGAELVSGHVHTVEVGEQVVALDVFADEADLAVLLGLIATVKVSQGKLKHASLQALRGDFGTLGASNKGLTTVTGGEHGRCLYDILVLQTEGINSLLLVSFLSLRKSLILSDSHLQ